MADPIPADLDPVVGRAWRGYVVYCACGVAINTLVWMAALVAITNRREWASQIVPEYVILVGGIALMAMGVFFAAVNLWLTQRPFTKHYYGLHFVNIVLGATSLIFTPLCLWLLVQWLRPEVKSAFGLSP